MYVLGLCNIVIYTLQYTFNVNIIYTFKRNFTFLDQTKNQNEFLYSNCTTIKTGMVSKTKAFINKTCVIDRNVTDYICVTKCIFHFMDLYHKMCIFIK